MRSSAVSSSFLAVLLVFLATTHGAWAQTTWPIASSAIQVAFDSHPLAQSGVIDGGLQLGGGTTLNYGSLTGVLTGPGVVVNEGTVSASSIVSGPVTVVNHAGLMTVSQATCTDTSLTNTIHGDLTNGAGCDGSNNYNFCARGQMSLGSGSWSALYCQS